GEFRNAFESVIKTVNTTGELPESDLQKLRELLEKSFTNPLLATAEDQQELRKLVESFDKYAANDLDLTAKKNDDILILSAKQLQELANIAESNREISKQRFL